MSFVIVGRVKLMNRKNEDLLQAFLLVGVEREVSYLIDYKNLIQELIDLSPVYRSYLC